MNKNKFESERRVFAAMAMQGLLANPNAVPDIIDRKGYYDIVAKEAVMAAESLIVELDNRHVDDTIKGKQ